MKTLVLTAALTLTAGAAAADHLMIDAGGASFSGRNITCPMVKIDKPGYLVIHAFDGDSPVIPASVGNVWLEAGETADVTVKLDARVMKDTKYLAMLHYETNGNTSYDFGPDNTADDGPALTAAGDIYMTEIKTAM